MNEVAGSVTLVVELIQGTLETDVTVPFTTRSGTATEEGMLGGNELLGENYENNTVCVCVRACACLRACVCV